MIAWKKIDNAKRVQKTGEYNDWKQEIAEDCFSQCVYCSINEGLWGGIDHYHIDHYRPKSRFEYLKNTITNLYYSCPICNRFKSDDWPNEPTDLNLICYPDPSDYDYSDLFNFDINTYLLEGKYKSATYLINRLYLNRPQLIYERREHILLLKAQAAVNDALKLIELSNDLNIVRKIAQTIANLDRHLHIRRNIIPYKLVEIRK